MHLHAPSLQRRAFTEFRAAARIGRGPDFVLGAADLSATSGQRRIKESVRDPRTSETEGVRRTNGQRQIEKSGRHHEPAEQRRI